MLTENKFKAFKDDYNVYGHTGADDGYGGYSQSLSSTAKGSINVMWHPVTDEAAIAEYGERVNRMYEAVLYEGSLDELDVVKINGENYEVRSIQRFNTHRLIRVEKI